MKLLAYGLIAGLAVAAAFGLHSQRFAIGCQSPDSSQFVEYSKNLYFDTSYSAEQIQKVEQQLRNGKTRVERAFGISTAEPTIIITNNAQTAASLGSNPTAATIVSPLGECIIIGPKGQNTDVFAHELVHAELAYRLGFYTQMTGLPVWFSEGLAMSVDNREPFRRSNIRLDDAEVTNVKQLFYSEEFFDGDKTTKHYQASKVAVAQILAKMGSKSLYRRLERVRSGDSFSSMFGF